MCRNTFMEDIKKENDNDVYVRLAQSFDKSKEEQTAVFEDASNELENLEIEKERLKREYKNAKIKSDELSSSLNECKSYSKHRYRIPNLRIDYLEAKSDSFAKGIGRNKLFIVFFIGSILGVVIESIWCIFRHNELQSRQGLIWGPFNPVYGIGAVLLTIFLYKYRNRSAIYSFLGSMIIGSALEYSLSFLQELFFGSVSWDYSALPFNLNGRICLLYSIFWGIIGVMWIKLLYPMISRITLNIPKEIGDNLVLILFIFMIINSLASISAVHRWSERINNVKAENALDIVLDKYYPDERMEKIYPNMVFT